MAISYNRLGSNGRHGNQMFQYAGFRGIASKNGYEWLIPPEDSESTCNYSLFECFKMESVQPENFGFGTGRTIDTGIFHFDEELFNNCPDWVTLWGFFQSEKYFLNVRDELLKDFSFIDDIENPCTEMMEGLNKPIALHVRRTDYAQYGHHPIVGLDYYEKALSYFDKDREVVVLSDDPTWCMEQSLFADDRFMISESRDQYIDLCLMTKCSDFIIANSSFSWWGAWLSTSSEKQVVAPMKWFGPPLDAQHNTKDLYCEGWMKL